MPQRNRRRGSGWKPGQKIKVRYLIRAAAIKSANDAAAALGDHIGGSEAAFASRMTRTARALGAEELDLQECPWPDRAGASVDRA